MLAESRSPGGLRGGDFYTFALRAPTRLAVVIGDACGRGRDGAALVPEVVPIVDSLLLSDLSPSALLREVNRAIFGKIPRDRFVTAAAFELDLGAGVLVGSCAGHVPMLLRNAETGVSAFCSASGPPLGILEDYGYEDASRELHRGDVAIFMTDGLLEALETDLVSMGTLRDILAEAPAGNGAVHRFLLAQLDRSTTKDRADDALLLSLEVTGESETSQAPHDGAA
ncbi:MAG TPA: PP2C family protein-serine/threonine phosphatase [Polyangiaceae bacterium]|nr:PP2C family protein-serine/threonine phosphatase [Polyangiaceae bacterium]